MSNDGYIMLHIIKSVAGDIVFMELLYEIWMDFVNSNAHYENSEHKGRFDENDENSRYEETRKNLFFKCKFFEIFLFFSLKATMDSHNLENNGQVLEN